MPPGRTFLPPPNLLVALLLALLQIVDPSFALCSRKECNCTLLEPRPGYSLPGTAAKCLFQKRQRLELEVGSFPESLVSLEIAGGKDVRFGPGAFSRLGRLERVRVWNVSKVYVGKGSLGNLSSAGWPPARFEFAEAESLVLEGGSFAPGRRPVSAAVDRVKVVIVQRAAFAWLADLTVTSVPRLDLLPEAFLLDNPKRTIAKEPSTNITLENVSMDSLGRGTFHSPVGLVRLRGVEVKRIKADAFSSMQLENLVIENSTIHKIESEAFSNRTLIKSLTLSHVKIHEIAPNALLSGLNNLAIEHSKLGSVHTGAINVTVAAVRLSNNILSRVFRKGFNLKEWNSISVINNTFKWVDKEAFAGPFLMNQFIPRPGPEFNFSGNSFQDVGTGAFDFDLTDELAVEIENNRFNFKCHCDMRVYVREVVTGSESAKDWVFETALCTVDRTLAQCFQLPEGWRNTMNFTDLVCGGRDQIVCEEVQRDAAVPAQVPSIVSQRGDRISVERREREKKVLGSIFLIILCGMLLMMVMSGFMWLRRKGYCTKARLMLLPSTNSLVNLLGRLFSGGGATPTGSISRLSVHEYAELQRKIEEGLSAAGAVEAAADDDAPLEHKSTQTLPEELTQELLQSLREKLDDPDNYREARDMIEHLYDLIKVEESCNRNEGETSSVQLEERRENVYDVIGRRRSEPAAASGKSLVSTGTRAPSPDKLLPLYGPRAPALVCEYVEPRDRRLHVYSELPQAPGMLCDYGEPTDATVHVYAELPSAPPPASGPSRGRMANRPLPSKPDAPDKEL